MKHDRLYQLTAIGRPLDFSYRTNIAIAMLIPLGALVMAVAAHLQGGDWKDVLVAALTGLVVVFGAWALARELAPDDDVGAFIGLGLAFATLRFDVPSLLLLFTAMLLVRIVNRSSGLAAKISDSVIVLALTLWTTYAMQTPLLGLVGALAFIFDAELRAGQRHQWPFALVSILGAVYVYNRFGVGAADPEPFSTLDTWLIAMVTVAYVALALLLDRVKAVGDATGIPLSLSRVRAGMFVGLLAASQALVHGNAGFEQVSLVWAVLAGVSLGGIGRMLPGAPAED